MSSGFVIVPLQMVPGSYFAFPYYIAFLAVIIAAAVMLGVFPSLRNPRRRKNILVYAVVMLVLVLLVFQIDNVSRQAIVDFGFAPTSNKAYAGQVNQAILSCQNHGDKTADFNLVLTSTNATFQPQQSYALINGKTVKVPFLLQIPGSPTGGVSKTVFFTVDANVSGFSFSTALEPRDSGRITAATGFSSVTYVWNGTENCYELRYAGGFTV